jgi:hypothetical protein
MRLLLLAALLSTTLAGAERGVVTVGPRADQPPETFPLDGAFVYQADPRCSSLGVGYVLPDLQKSVCMRGAAIEYLVREVGAKRVVPGFKFKTCDWAWSSDSSWAFCTERAIREATPELRFGQSPFWTRGNIGGELYEGCAAGVAYQSHVRVSIADLPRSYLLSAWEPTNSVLFYLLDLPGDGPVTAAATAYAAAECGI